MPEDWSIEPSGALSFFHFVYLLPIEWRKGHYWNCLIKFKKALPSNEERGSRIKTLCVFFSAIEITLITYFPPLPTRDRSVDGMLSCWRRTPGNTILRGVRRNSSLWKLCLCGLPYPDCKCNHNSWFDIDTFLLDPP